MTQLQMDITQNPFLIQNIIFDCNHSEIYRPTRERGQSNEFKWLPGHRALIVSWCSNLSGTSSKSIESIESFNLNHPAFPPILREIIKNTLANHNNQMRRFSELLLDFCIYIYIMAGKASYEILCENLSLPKPYTISEYTKTQTKH